MAETKAISQNISQRRDWNSSDVSIALQTVIAFSAIIFVLFSLIHYSISPIKKDIAKLEAGQTKLETDINSLKAGQAKLNMRMDGIESKIDQLLAKKP